jgi:hypothetical protein
MRRAALLAIVAALLAWGGPERARIVGRLRGRAIDAHFDRSDACGMEQWQLAAPLLALP